MPSDEIERLLERIGKVLAEDTEYPLDGTLLYARVGDQSVAPSIFKDRGNHVLYRSPNLDVICPVLFDLRDEEVEHTRWAEIEFMVRDGRFEAIYTYSNEIDEDEDTFVRRDRIVAKWFGSKPIVYPDPPHYPPLADGEYLYDY